MKRLNWKLFLPIAIIIIVGVAAYFTVLETHPPEIEWTDRVEYLGEGATITIDISDKGMGLGLVEVFYKGAAGERSIYSEDLSKRSPAMKEAELGLNIPLRELGIKDGKGTIRVTLVDRSFRKNRAEAEYSVTVDTTPPSIRLLTFDHSVTRGGAEIVAYRTSSDVAETGVRIDDRWFRAYNKSLGDESRYLAFFSYPYNLDPGEPVIIEARDRAGNLSTRKLGVLVKNKKYRKRRIGLSDRFLERKVPALLEGAGLAVTGSNITDFNVVNREMRQRNEALIAELTSGSSERMLWKGSFLQMRNSQVMARYADFRTYTYEGKDVDKLYHLGVDLAAVKRHPVGASNNGVVVFADALGIYGNTVIIDHGMGLYTLYSHLSSIDVNKGDEVSRGERIGRTGQTGLAGGDHLHFGVYLSGTPVLPLEWWDGGWIKKRITRRIKAASKKVD